DPLGGGLVMGHVLLRRMSSSMLRVFRDHTDRLRACQAPRPTAFAARSGGGVGLLLRVLSPGGGDRHVSTLSEKVLNLPAVPGVYLFKGAGGKVLYVGKAKSLASRVRSYLGDEGFDPWRRELMDRAADLDTILTDSEVEALLLESSLIRQYQPPFNVLLKDDKSFPYVRVSVQEPFARLSVTRQVRADGARYLGPF